MYPERTEIRKHQDVKGTWAHYDRWNVRHGKRAQGRLPSVYEGHSTALLFFSQLLDSRGSSIRAWSPGPEVLLLWLCVAPIFIWG